MRVAKIFAGDRLRRLRAGQDMTQAALAGQLGLSPSYLNQIEHDQRPLTPAIIAGLAGLFGVPESYFADAADIQHARDLREATADPLFGAVAVSAEEAQAAVRAAPEVTERFLTLYRAYLVLNEQNQELKDRLSARPAAASPASRFAYDEVRDWMQVERNHFPALDLAAERIFEDGGFQIASLREDLERRLREKHGITVATDAGLLGQGLFWRITRGSRQLLLAEEASPESRLFWMAHIIGQLEQRRLIEQAVRRARLSTDEARGLARIGLANYFAGALLMPYGRFLAEAEALRYDIERLQSRFATSFEQTCHRLSTLQRPGAPGIPFFFVKTDIAGNVLKRSSATRFQFARFGGPCPLWNVYRAFAHPGQILVQLARTPDQMMYLNIARTVGRGGGAYLSRPRSVAVVLGCEVRYAARTVYATGLDLTSPETADPIGPGCRACERTNCRHRAVPPVGPALDVGTAERGVVPYRLRS